MKKLLVILCMSAMLTGLAACGNKDENPDATTGSDSVGNSTAQESETQSTADAESETQDTAEAEGGTESIDAGDENLSGENAGGQSEEMRALLDAVREELGDDYFPNSEMPAEWMEMTFGLTSDMYEDFIGEMPMISTNVDMLLIVKAAEGQADAVEKALLDYQKKRQEGTMEYPQNLDKIQGSKVERIDNYVIFAQLGGEVISLGDPGSDAAITHVQEQNQRALDVIKQNLAQ